MEVELSKSDQELLLALQGGQLEALGELYDRHQRLVYRASLAITGDPEAAADLLHDVFLRLHRFAHRVDPSRPLEPWLYRVTVNQASTWVKRHRWMRPIDDLTEWLIGEGRNSTSQQIERQEEWLAIEQAMVTLPLAQRTVIALYYVNDLSLQEIAKILDIPTGTVKSRLHYGRRGLREIMSQHADRIPEVVYEFT
jgi:RNA polymerase sigma-70 factor (ECF subfamily)